MGGGGAEFWFVKMASTAEEDPTLRFHHVSEPIDSAYTFDKVEPTPAGDLRVSVRIRGFMRQNESKQLESVVPKDFFDALKSHLANVHISLNLDHGQHQVTATQRYNALVQEVRRALTGKNRDRYRADKKPENRRKFLNRFLNLCLPVGCWTAGTTATLEQVRERVVVLEGELNEKESEAASLREQVDELREEVKSLLTRIEKSERAHQQEIDSLRSEIEALSRSNEEKDNRIADLEEKLLAAVKNIEELEGNLAVANNNTFDSLKHLEEIEEKCSDAQKKK